jgi:hypothetical protein
LLLRDLPSVYKTLSGSGIYFNRGGAKPAVTAFRFPFVALAAGHGIVTLWGRAPTQGVVSIQLKRGHGWRRLTQLTTTSGGVFYARRHAGRGRVLRAVSAGIASRAWSTG